MLRLWLAVLLVLVCGFAISAWAQPFPGGKILITPQISALGTLSPTFSGTVTMPDGCTWASGGITCGVIVTNTSAGAATTPLQLINNSGTASTATILQAQPSAGSARVGQIKWINDGSNAISTSFINNQGATVETILQLIPAGTDGLIVTSSSGQVNIAASASDVINITSSALVMSVANKNANLSPTGTGTVTLGPPAGQLVFSNLSTGTNADFLCLSGGGVVLLQTTACTISDENLKNMFGVLKESALAEVMALGRPQLFTLKDGDTNPDWNAGTLQIGFTAQKMASVDPRLAIYYDDHVSPKSYRQESVLALALGAIQELKAENDNLRVRIARLEKSAKGRRG